MTPIQAPDGTTCLFPTPLVEGVVSEAERAADQVGELLRELFEDVEGPVRLPLGLTLELAALTRLRGWEQAGICFQGVLPTYAEAIEALLDRMESEPSSFSVENAVLARQVLTAWIDRFAWQGQTLLKADILVGDADEDVFVDAICRFLIENGGRLDSLLDGLGETT